MFPHALQPLFTHSEVSPRILGGADLMLQGVIAPEGGLGDWEADDKRCVSVPGNPYGFGVGSMAVSSASLAKTGLKGRGLKLLHHYPDRRVRLALGGWRVARGWRGKAARLTARVVQLTRRCAAARAQPVGHGRQVRA